MNTNEPSGNDIDDLEEAEERRLHRMPGGDNPAPEWVARPIARFELVIDDEDHETAECVVMERYPGNGWDWSVKLRRDEGEQLYSAEGWQEQQSDAQRAAFRALQIFKGRG